MFNSVYAVIEHCMREYGGFAKQQGDLLFIWCGNDLFKINLTDRARFGKYDLFHRNATRSDDGQRHYHRQFSSKRLETLIIKAWTHDFNKRYGIDTSFEDIDQFKADAWRYWSGNKDLFGEVVIDYE